MTEPEVIDAETGELVPAVVTSAPVNLFGGQNPAEIVRRATENANALAEVIKAKRLFKNIGGKSHVLVEGWTLLGSMVGVFPVVVWTRQLDDQGWEARVEARTMAGQVVGAAEAECRPSESNWAKRDSYALRSMAQTRATSKALRGPLGFIVSLAGFEATPADEVPANKTDDRKATAAQHRKLQAMISDLKKDRPDYDWEGASKAIAKEMGKDSRADLSVTEMSDLLEALPVADVPFR